MNRYVFFCKKKKSKIGLSVENRKTHPKWKHPTPLALAFQASKKRHHFAARPESPDDGNHQIS